MEYDYYLEQKYLYEGRVEARILTAAQAQAMGYEDDYRGSRAGYKLYVDGFNTIEAMAQLEEYVSMASDEVKEAVRTVSEDVKAEIQSHAPVKTGKYKKSWTVTKVEETAQSLVNTVHSAKHYRLTHLLENGHAKRGGGRTRSFPHIAPGEALAEKELLEIAERKLRG